MLTCFDHWTGRVRFSSDGFNLMGFAGIALSKGFFCFSYALFKMDVCVVCGVPLSNQ